MVQTDKTFQTPSGEILGAYGTLQNVSIRHEDIEVILDFHIFDVQDFDLLVGQPIEKFLMNALTQNKLEVVAEPPELSQLKCAGHHHKGKTN